MFSIFKIIRNTNTQISSQLLISISQLGCETSFDVYWTIVFQLANYEKDKASLQSAKARLRVQEQELGKLQWEHEVLRQRFEQTQNERDELYNKFVTAIHEVQQKSNFKNLLLEKKLGALADTLEKKVHGCFLSLEIRKVLSRAY